MSPGRLLGLLSRWRGVLLAVAIVVAAVVSREALASNPRGAVIVASTILSVAFLRLLVLDEGESRARPFTDLVAAPTVFSGAGTDVRDRERTIQLATATAGDAHRLLRPLVADLVGEWLQSTHGVGLDHPDAARLVPNDLWDIVRPGRPRPENPHGPGPTAARVGEIVDRLEALP